MKKLIFSFILFLLTAGYVMGQTAQWQWAERAGGVGSHGGGGSDDEATDIAVDNEGNTYVCGTIYDSFFASFDTMKVKTYGDNDMFIAKYDCDGLLQWVKIAGGEQGADQGIAVEVDTINKFLYIIGRINSDNLTPWKFGSDTTVTANHLDFFLMQLDFDGNMKWMFAGESIGSNFGMSLDSSGNIYTVFSVSTAPSGPFAPGYNLTTGYYLGKFDSTGNLLWVDSLWGGGAATFTDIATDKDGNSYISGGFEDTVIISGQQLIEANGAFKNSFIAKYNSSGNLQWITRSRGFYEGIEAVVVDEYSNVYATGGIGRDAIFGTDTLNPTGVSSAGVPFIVKYSSNGSYKWGRYAISPFPSSTALGITINPVNNNPIICGEVKGVMSFEGMPIGTTGIQNSFFVEYDIAGNGVRAKALPASGIDMNNAFAIAAGYNGIVFLAGSFGNDLKLPSDTINSVGGNSDIFVAKYGIEECQDTTTDDTTGIAVFTIDKHFPLLIYPNPTNGEFTIELTERIRKAVFSVYNTVGQLVYVEKFGQQNSDLFRKTIELYQKPGVYYVRLDTEKGGYFQKLVIR